MKDNPFFCYKKNCRKTAWDTPNYLTENDWEFAKKIVKILKNKKSTDLYNFLWYNKTVDLSINFFNRCLGWPEGAVYCRDLSFVTKTAFDAIKRHDLFKLESAIVKHNLDKNNGL